MRVMMPTVVAFHFPHKTASMFAFQVLDKIAQQTGLTHISQNRSPPNHADIADLVKLASERVILRGPVRNFGVTSAGYVDNPEDYRFVTTRELLDASRYRAICQTRDVLDLVVSQYFSHGWIHFENNQWKNVRSELQAGRISVFDYALMEFDGRSEFGQDSIIKKLKYLKVLKQTLGPENCLIVRYEDMMLHFNTWSSSIANFLQDEVPIMGDVLRACRPEYRAPPDIDEFFPDPLEYVRKNQHELLHVRSAYPGDHRRFLTPTEILDLRAIVDRSLAAVGQRDGRDGDTRGVNDFPWSNGFKVEIAWGQNQSE